MDIILTENIFDSKLESRNECGTNLFDCLAPETMNDDSTQTTPPEPSDNSEVPDDHSSSADKPIDETEMLSNAENTSSNNADENAAESFVENAAESNIEDAADKPEIADDTEETSDKVNEFVPTIIDIRGSCNESLEFTDISSGADASHKESTVDSDNKVSDTSAEGEEKDAICITDSSNNADVLTINDEDEPDCDQSAVVKSGVLFTSNVTIKQEPRDDDDCMLVDADDIGTCFTSEIEIKEERTNGDNNDSEVQCIETTSKIPLPIPIKVEANFDNEKEVTTSSKLNVDEKSKIDDDEGGDGDDEGDNGSAVSSATSPTTATATTTTSSPHKSTSPATTAATPTSPNTPSKTPKLYSSVGYTCYLCETTFGEHELLNEHMKLHRNNSLAERYNKAYSKHRKATKYICRTCGKRLSTGQSLAQHMMIHNNEKPHVCPICKKDFRHLSNFKMHVQKHKEEEEHRRRQREKQRLYAKIPPIMGDRSVARSADFGRLVGPLFVKESLLKSTSIGSLTPVQKIERKSFDLSTTPKYAKAPPVPIPRRHQDSLKENMIFYKKPGAVTVLTTPTVSPMVSGVVYGDDTYSRARKFNDDIGDDVIPLKTFNNVENIVMNATKFIVKVDNLDANALKKKIKTPDISIDKSALENKPPDRKRRIQLSPADGASKRLKLDEIENIIMDADGDADDNATYDDLPDYDYQDELSDAEDAPKTKPKQETLTDNELFELLNDDRDSQDGTKSCAEEAAFTPARSPVIEEKTSKSNVIVLKSCSPSPAKSPVVSQTPPRPESLLPASATDNQPEVSADVASSVKATSLNDNLSHLMEEATEEEVDEDDEGASLDKCDMYDNAFRNVALRRLTLIRKKASQNGGKVENKYLLGPLFWRKALRKAQRNQLTREPVMTLNEAKLAYKRLNAMKFGKFDTRRTNDAAKLQQRAELKLQYILGRLRMMNDTSRVNLAGPLFWRRTLKLAGIHEPTDLKRLLVEERLSIDDVEFVETKVTEQPRVPDQAPDTELNGNEPADECLSPTRAPTSTTPLLLPVPSPAPVLPPALLATPQIPVTTQISAPTSTLMLVTNANETVTGSDFLENIVVQKAPQTPTATNLFAVTNGDKIIVDGMLNDDLLKVKRPPTLIQPSPRSTLAITPPIPQVLRTTADSTKEFDRRAASKAESILYDSLTKPRAGSLNAAVKENAANSPRLKNDLTLVSSLRKTNALSSQAKRNSVGGSGGRSTSTTRKSAARSAAPKPAVSRFATPTCTPTATAINIDRGVSLMTDSTLHQVPDSTTLETGNIILNVDSADFQLIADAKNENGQETNYVLVSDENGGVQLIKENDLRLVEDGVSNTQYIVNMPAENFANFDLMANASNGEQLAYTIQLDGENYAALQFVQDGMPLVEDKQKILTDKNVTIGGTNYVIADPSADLNHIGKELSDFLHIDYSTLLKNDNDEQAT